MANQQRTDRHVARRAGRVPAPVNGPRPWPRSARTARSTSSPCGYAVLDVHVWIETKAKSQKVVNLRRDPRMSFLVEGRPDL